MYLHRKWDEKCQDIFMRQYETETTLLDNPAQQERLDMGLTKL